MTRLFVPVQLGEMLSQRSDPYDGTYSLWKGILSRKDDLLVGKGGGGPQSIEIYSKLLNDPVVFSGFDKVVSEITQREWHIAAASDKPEDKAIAEFVQECFNNLGANVDQDRNGKLLLGGSNGIHALFRGLLEAYITGLAIAEPKWKLEKDRIVPSEVKIRDPRRLMFVLLENGLVEPRILTKDFSVDGQPLPPRGLIIHRHWASIMTDVYGSGIGRHLYYLVDFRKAETSNWLAYADRFTLPTAIATYPLGLSPEEIIKLENGLRGLGRETAVVVPEGVAITWLKAEGDPGLYEKILQYCDALTSNIISGESIIGQEGSGGSRARDAIADSVRIRKCKALADGLCDTINNTLIKWIVELNFSNKANRPHLVIDFSDLETSADRAEIVKLAADLGQLGYEIDEEWLKSNLKMPIKKIQADQIPSINPEGEGVEEAPIEEPTEDQSEE